ncbi:MAG: hypothetical protein CME88_17060 [Hirschia sp.]|nr:hypothetical protein [Hirschia sp.]MBF20087.1 hypothetical protein [Hirschia sp.]
MGFLQDKLHVLVPAKPTHFIYILILTGLLAVSNILLLEGPRQYAGFGLALILAWACVIDLTRYRLPDILTWSMILSGLVFAGLFEVETLTSAVIGAGLGYAAFALVRWAFLRLRGKEGLGLGDAKLLAGCGAWLGWLALPGVLLIASATGLAFVVVLAIGLRKTVTRIAFGPAIILGFWWVWLFGPVGVY